MAEQHPEHRPPPESGARPIHVRKPGEVRRRGYQPPEPDTAAEAVGEDRGGRERNRRWRTGRPDPPEGR